MSSEQYFPTPDTAPRTPTRRSRHSDIAAAPSSTSTHKKKRSDTLSLSGQSSSLRRRRQRARARPRRESSDVDVDADADAEKSDRTVRIDGAVVNLGTKCRIVRVSRDLVLKQPHPMRRGGEEDDDDDGEEGGVDEEGEGNAAADENENDKSEHDDDDDGEEDDGDGQALLSQHEWSHFLKNEAQHRWETHIYDLLQTNDHSPRPIFHANVLPVPYTSPTNGMYMLYIPDTLEQRIARHAASPVCDFQRMQWIHGVSRALAWLETKGLVYTNLAPRHILLYRHRYRAHAQPQPQPPHSHSHEQQDEEDEDGGEAVLCDFALTEREGGGMPTKYDLRDFRYLATWADKRSAETDLWSLGCLGYFLITGHAPFGELQARRAMNLLEERWHPDFWNGEVSTLIPFVSKCWFCEHCAPRGSVTPFANVAEAAKYWDDLAGAIVSERGFTSMLAPMCKVAYHEQQGHLQVLDRMLAREALVWGGEVIAPLVREAQRIERGQGEGGPQRSSPGGSVKSRSEASRSEIGEKKCERKKRSRDFACDVSGGEIDHFHVGVAVTAIICVVAAASMVGVAVYHRYFRRS